MKIKDDIVGTEVEFVLDGMLVSAVIKSVASAEPKPKKKTKKTKAKVEVSNFSPILVRYIRLHERVWPWSAGYTINSTTKISNLGGITIVARIDYADMTVTIAHATAAIDENFSRKVGYNIAIERLHGGDSVTLAYDPALTITEHFLDWAEQEADHLTKKMVMKYTDQCSGVGGY
jgi:hypothetical protein